MTATATNNFGAFEVRFWNGLTNGRKYWFVYDTVNGRTCGGWMGTRGEYATAEAAQERARQLFTLYPNG